LGFADLVQTLLLDAHAFAGGIQETWKLVNQVLVQLPSQLQCLDVLGIADLAGWYMDAQSEVVGAAIDNVTYLIQTAIE
jgi:hypothetical protein